MEDLGRMAALGGVGWLSIPLPLDPTTMVGSQWRLLGQHMLKFRQDVGW